MPYELRKNPLNNMYKVYNKLTNKAMSKIWLTHSRALSQMRAIIINEMRRINNKKIKS